MTTTTKTALRWRGLSSTVTVRYLSRRIGRSQNGMARGSPAPFPLAGAEPGPFPAACWAGGEAGLRSAAGRCRGPAPVLAPGQPAEAGLCGQAGAGWREPDPPVPLVPLVLLAVLLVGGGPPDVARDRAGGDPAAGECPAPRDQLAAALAGALPPVALSPVAGPPVSDLGGRSSGGAARAPLSASGMVRLRVSPAAAPRRDPGLVSPSPSAAGGASGRNRDAYASPVAPGPVPVPAAVSPPVAAAVAAPAPTPPATPAATAAAWPGFRRAHRAAR